MNIGQLDGQPLALQIFNGMTAESICVNERWAKDQLFRCVCFAGGQIKSTPSIAWRTLCRLSKKSSIAGLFRIYMVK